MVEMCWDVNPNCQMVGMDTEKASCHAYMERKGCWMVNWASIIGAMDGGANPTGSHIWSLNVPCVLFMRNIK